MVNGLIDFENQKRLKKLKKHANLKMSDFNNTKQIVPQAYGMKTAQVLDNYLDSYQTPDWPNYFGPRIAGMIDFVRNYRDMKKLNLEPSDHFFHCKANYEATKRGQEGLSTALKFGALRETWNQIVKGDSGQSSIADFSANYRGQRGALNGKTLKETCPTFYKDYEKW